MNLADGWIIVPAYNEAPVILETLKPLIAAGYQVILVDDASSDGTRQLVESLSGVRYIRHAVNLGQGAALQTGMAYAHQQQARWVVHFDADGQHRLADIPVLLEPLVDGRADVALGSRFLSKAGRQAVPWRRRLLLKVGILVNFLFSGLWLKDAHNGLRALNHQALARIELKSAGMAHATEILQQIRNHHLRWE
ncbi:MAG: glycosyltransferase family 2 protein, partial [Bacteroidota bacterium]